MRVTSLFVGFIGLVRAEEEAQYVDTPDTTNLWQFIAKSDASKTEETLEAFLFVKPQISVARSADHRGGLWWAWEYRNAHAIAALEVYAGELLSKSGEAHPHSAETDKEGLTPKGMCIKAIKESANKVVDDEDDDDDDDVDDIDEAELKRRKKEREQKQKEKAKIKNASDSELEAMCNDLVKDNEELKKEIHARRVARQERLDAELDVDDDDDSDDEDEIRIHKETPSERSNPAQKTDEGSLNVDVDDEDEDE